MRHPGTTTFIYYISPEITEYKLFRKLHHTHAHDHDHNDNGNDADDHTRDDHKRDDYNDNADDHTPDHHKPENRYPNDHTPDNATSNADSNLLVQPSLEKTKFAEKINADDHKVIDPNTLILDLDRNEIVSSSTIIQGVGDVEVRGEAPNNILNRHCSRCLCW